MAGEPLGRPDAYGADRFFVVLEVAGEDAAPDDDVYVTFSVQVETPPVVVHEGVPIFESVPCDGLVMLKVRLFASASLPERVITFAVFLTAETDWSLATGMVLMLTVPGDVSVVGYDDSAWLNCTDPPLTTVRQPIESMGKSAVALLVGQMETTAAHSEELLFEPELVVRGSTGPAPVRV